MEQARSRDGRTRAEQNGTQEAARGYGVCSVDFPEVRLTNFILKA